MYGLGYEYRTSANKGLCFFLTLTGKDAFGRTSDTAVLQVPRSLPRVIALPEEIARLLSACTSASLEPSYVLRALGRNDELAHSSIRFSIGRYTSAEDIDYTIEHVRHAVDKLRDLSPLWDMYKEGIDLESVEWVAH